MYYKIKNRGTRGVKSGIKKMRTEAKNEKAKKGGRGVLSFYFKNGLNIFSWAIVVAGPCPG